VVDTVQAGGLKSTSVATAVEGMEGLEDLLKIRLLKPFLEEGGLSYRTVVVVTCPVRFAGDMVEVPKEDRAFLNRGGD
jgi:hypothetical protein